MWVSGAIRVRALGHAELEISECLIVNRLNLIACFANAIPLIKRKGKYSEFSGQKMRVTGK
jgi:hypothetical protein